MLRLGVGVASRRLPGVCSVVVVPARVNSTEAATATVASDLPKGWETAKPFDQMPGPKPLPLIGNMWRFMPVIGEFYGKDLVHLHDDFIAKYGNIMRLGGIPGRDDMVMLYDPEDAEKVFRNEGAWPIREGIHSFAYYRNVTRKDFFQGAGGALATQGEEWGKFRSTVNQPMMQPRVAKVYVAPIDLVAGDFLKRIAALRDAKGELPGDFINEMYKWALESIVMIALDTRLGCLEGKLGPNSEAQMMIDNVQVIFNGMFIMDTKIPIWKVFSTKTWKNFVKAMDSMTELSMKYIDKSRERLAALPPDSPHEKSVLERILERDPNPKTACTMALDMMIAGVDTTSTSVAFLMYHLATNPDKQAKLQKEIDTVIPRGTTTPITADNLNDLKYLRACIKESMRITPIAIGNMRQSVKDLVIQGYRIPKGTDIAIGHITMCHMEKNYTKAKEFIPERWIKGEQENADKTANPFVFLPFGFGPRSCVGRRFAELEIEVLVTKIVQAYQIEWHQPPLESESKLLNTITSPLKFTLIDRK